MIYVIANAFDSFYLFPHTRLSHTNVWDETNARQDIDPDVAIVVWAISLGVDGDGGALQPNMCLWRRY